MALNATTLAAAITDRDLSFKATAATGATVGKPVIIDHEVMVVKAINGTTIDVRSRGDMGTACAAHAILAPVTFTESAADLPVAGIGQTTKFPLAPDFVTAGADGAIAVPTKDTIVIVTKATAAALTLAAPSAASDGVKLTVLSSTAAAHTVTYAAGFYGDTTSSDVATFAAKAGASATFIAYKGAWGVYALGNVTLG